MLGDKIMTKDIHNIACTLNSVPIGWKRQIFPDEVRPVAIQSRDGKYLAVKWGRHDNRTCWGQLAADRGWFARREAMFQRVELDGTKFALFAPNGGYVRTELDPDLASADLEGTLIADSDRIGKNEEFTLETRGQQRPAQIAKVALRAANGKYVKAAGGPAFEELNGVDGCVAAASSKASADTFTIEYLQPYLLVIEEVKCIAPAAAGTKYPCLLLVHADKDLMTDERKQLSAGETWRLPEAESTLVFYKLAQLNLNICLCRGLLELPIGNVDVEPKKQEAREVAFSGTLGEYRLRFRVEQGPTQGTALPGMTIQKLPDRSRLPLRARRPRPVP